MDTITKYINESSKYSLEEVAEYMASEGLGYAVQHGMNWRKIEDKKLSVLWKKAADTLNSIEAMLSDYEVEM